MRLQSFTIEGAKDAACPRCGADYSGGVGRGLARKPLTEEEAYRLTRRDYEAWIKEEGSHRRHSERLYAGGLLSRLTAKQLGGQLALFMQQRALVFD